jgi:DHA3 family macrolide efflux protein-like MFS transporter
MATAALTKTKPPSPFAVFRNRNFALMWTGQLISTMGSALTSLAASIFVYQKTGSAASVGLMLMATAAPSLVVGLIAGVFVDRFDRKRIMIAADIIRGILVLLIPFLVPQSIAWLYIVVMLSSAVGQFFDPAHESVLPEVASEEELAAANSLMAISSFGSTAVGFAASGFLASINIYYAFYLDALTFAISAICILLIKIKPMGEVEKTSVQSVIRNLQVGIRHLYNTPILRSMFYVSIPVVISFGLSNALLLPFAKTALGATEFQYGVQEAMTSIGFVAGSLILAGIFDRMREGPWIAISYLGMAIAGIFYSISTSIPIAIIILTISGFLNPPSSIGRRLVIQRNTPREMRGRVNSAFFVSRDVLFLVGMACAGLADVINVRVMYLISSVMILGAGIWVLFLPGLRQEAAEWKRALGLLKTSSTAPGLGTGRAASLEDFDALVGLLPVLSTLSNQDKEMMVKQARIIEAQAGTAILRHGETGDAAFFILSGRAVAGIQTEGGDYRSLSVMQAGDFFGEIAALTGAKRTANVVAENDTTLVQVPGETLRTLMNNPALSQLFLTKMTERLTRTSIQDLPRFAGPDQKDIKELREN